MHAVLVPLLIFALAAKALLRAHHGPPREGWERALTTLTATLTVITLVVFLRDAQRLVQ
jgi:hypothetical protein